MSIYTTLFPFYVCRMMTCLALFPILIQADTVERKLIWQDEFNYVGFPNNNKWTYEKGLVRNNENQYYTVKDPNNVFVEHGYLTIQAKQEGFWPATGALDWLFSTQRKKKYSSASLTTEHLSGWQYGRVEVRAKLPQGRGVWPAIWLVGKNFREVGWPTCGEIDIMEYVGFKPKTIHSVLHSKAYNHRKNNSINGRVQLDDLATEFHLYAVERFVDHIDFWIDDKLHFSYKKEPNNKDAWPFDQEMYLIINLAIGGSWGGQKGIDKSIFPQRFIIDYVRVFEWQ